MKILEGKSPSEKKKLIAAMVLGGLALLTLTYTFGGMFFGGGRKTTVTVNVSPTPTATVSSAGNTTQTSTIQTLTPDQINDVWLTTPVTYYPGSFYAPDAGRNIFAFYEPPQPTPYEYVPVVEKQSPTPVITPAPTPPVQVAYVSPQSVYAGSKSFRLEVNGDKFTPDAMIIWSGSQIPTNFVSPQKLTADINANLIAGEGQRQIEVRTPDGKLYSNPVMLNVQAPPRPTVQYIGVQMARRGNNNTAYFREQGNPPIEFGQRLGEILNVKSINNRFRVASISVNEVILEDTTLGFRHKLPMARPTGAGGGGGSVTTPSRGGFDRTTTPGRFPTDGTTVVPYPTTPQTQEIPGIPSNIPRYVPPTPQQQQQQKKDDEDDEDGDN